MTVDYRHMALWKIYEWLGIELRAFMHARASFFFYSNAISGRVKLSPKYLNLNKLRRSSLKYKSSSISFHPTGFLYNIASCSQGLGTTTPHCLSNLDSLRRMYRVSVPTSVRPGYVTDCSWLTSLNSKLFPLQNENTLSSHKIAMKIKA